MKPLLSQYKTIVIDPPWPGPGEARSLKGGESVVIPYSTMTGIQVSALGVGSLATDDAQLWLWAPSRQVGDAFLLLQLWGFRYAGLFIWQKPPGLGAWCRHDVEFLLRGVRPRAKHVLPAPKQTYHWPRPKQHSRKPGEAYDLIRSLSDGPRLDIFARENRPGFEAWGDQKDLLTNK